jgi:hypothetical protein
MREIRVGMRVNMKTGAEFFGLDDVNALIDQGWGVLGVREGALITTRTGNDDAANETVGRIKPSRLFRLCVAATLPRSIHRHT